MDKPIFKVESWADVPRAIALYQQVGAHHRVPALQALYAGRIAYWEAMRVGSMGTCKRFLAQVRRPALVIIGDDDDTPTGPGGWPMAERLLRWARGVILHGAGAEVEHYAAAVRLAEGLGNVVLIEATSANVAVWKAAIGRWAPQAFKAGIEVRAPDTHPIPRKPGDVH